MARTPKRFWCRAGLGIVVFCWGLLACNKGKEPEQPSDTSPEPSSDEAEAQLPLTLPSSSPTPSRPAARPTPSGPTSGAKHVPTRASELPEDVVVGDLVEMELPGYRPLRVSHADANDSHAIVYLHGMCGNPKGADGWVDLANRHGTFIVVRAPIKCPERPGYKWPLDVTLIQDEITAALDRVHVARSGALDTESVTLMGYSQGAHRAERLAEKYPDVYRRVVLGGPPTVPEAARLARADRVAVLGGELENTTDIETGVSSLGDAGITSRFFLLPRAHHGSYGPRGREVMLEVLDFLFSPPDSRDTPARTTSGRQALGDARHPARRSSR